MIIDVGGAEPGTMVNMRYRSLNPGVWSDVQSKALERDETTVTFDIRGLEPEHDYEVQTWLGNNRPPVDDRCLVGSDGGCAEDLQDDLASRGRDVRWRRRRWFRRAHRSDRAVDTFGQDERRRRGGFVRGGVGSPRTAGQRSCGQGAVRTGVP